MAYSIRLSERAYSDIDAIVAYIHADSPIHAVRWRSRLLEKIAALDLSPHGYPIAPEDEYTPFEVRHAVFGLYRILFTVADDHQTVHVLTVRHSARRILSPEELSEIE